MKKCNSCNINFRTNEKYCPLCQNILVGEENDSLFARNIRYKTNSIILRVLLFSSIVILLLSGFIELVFFTKLKITFYIILGLITNYIVFYSILKSYQNIYRMFGRYGLIIILLLLMWYIFIPNHIITDFIIPTVCILELLFNGIIGIILRKNYFLKYSSQLLVNLILLMLPMILVLFKLTSNNILSYVCCLLCLISISGLLIFWFDEIKEELSKIFNL